MDSHAQHRGQENWREQISCLPPLNSQNAARQSVTCKMCGKPAPIFDVLDIQKHCSHDDPYSYGLAGIEVPYFRCESCGFLFTNFFDLWETIDWRRFIYNDDYIKVDPEYEGQRSARIAQDIAPLLQGCENLRILDYGSGSGVFAHEMRHIGFTNVQTYDPFSSPERPQGPFDLITCFEALEHTVSPRHAIEDIHSFLAPGGCLIFSQSIQPNNIHEIRGAWWYLAPRNGHISTFTIDTLPLLAPSSVHHLHGNGWLWGFRAPGTSPELTAAIQRIGPAIYTLCLTAPSTGHEDQWHTPERTGESWFRWSKSAHLEWETPPGLQFPALLCLRVPYRLEIREGFAAGCHLRVGGREGEIAITKSDILARVHLDAAPENTSILFETPEPCSPYDLRGAPDARKLGLYIQAA